MEKLLAVTTALLATLSTSSVFAYITLENRKTSIASAYRLFSAPVTAAKASRQGMVQIREGVIAMKPQPKTG